MTSNTSLLKIAQKHLGQGGAKFRKFCGLPSGAAWCNAFVDYVANEGGVKTLYFNGRKETYCPNSIKWCQKNLAQIPLFLALPMDIIYFDWERNGVPNHIGFVRKRNTTSSIYTIEGNTDGGKVAQKTRPAKYVQAIYRPHFVPTEPLKKCKLDETNTQTGYVFVYNLQCALGMKPTGILTKETVKILQKRAKATEDGQWGPGTSRHVQQMTGAKADGDFGPNSVIALKKWINGINYPPSNKKPSEAKPAPQTKGYTGKFPTPNTNAKIINGLAYKYCYPYGTPQKKYKYSTGKPKPEYAKGIDTAYPNHKSWPNKKQRVGACCDVFTGSCLGNVGIRVPKDLKNQLTEMPKMTKQLKSNGHYKASDFKLGDIVQRGRKDKSGHTFIICELVDGTRYIANAHYKKLKGTYAVMDSKSLTQKPSKWKYYKCYTALGAKRTWYGLGDYGYDVLYIQKFLKWYGYNLTANGYYGESTEKAVNLFQKAQGWKPCGQVGENTIKAMKAVKK